MRELQRFAVRSAVVPLAATLAIALAAVTLLERTLTTVVFVRRNTGDVVLDHVMFARLGDFVVGGRVVNWSGPLHGLLQLALLAGLATAALRLRRSRLRQCMRCESQIPAAATVCCRCRRRSGD